MEKRHTDAAMERLNQKLNDDEARAAYKKPYDDYQTRFVPRALGGLLVWCGNIVYGEEPSYLKFRAVEVIARLPYQSWAASMYTLLTLHFSDEHRAMELSKVAKFARLAQDNETMHVVVVSQFAKQEESITFFRYTFIPMFFGFFYYWASYLLFLIKPRYSYELNYLFECHAFEQYDRFLREYGEELKKKPAVSEFLAWYGRTPENQYEFFQSLRNDELIHRNSSIEQIGK